MGTVRVLSTKKLLPNQKQFLLNAGLSVLEADFITIRYTPFELKNIRQNLIFTSQNAVKGFLAEQIAEDYKSHPVFCVGTKTRELIEKAGFTVTASADYAEELALEITRGHAGEGFTFFSGSLRRDTLPEALAKANVSFNEVEVYETLLSPHTINASPNAILFFSPSGVESFLKENEIGNAVCFCIGKTTGEALDGIADKIVVASKPTVENVIVQCISYFEKTR